MPLMPFHVLGIWLRGLLALALLLAGPWLLWEGYREAQPRRVVVTRGVVDPAASGAGRRPVEEVETIAWRPGLNRPTALLAGGLALLVWSLAGGLIARSLLTLGS